MQHQIEDRTRLAVAEERLASKLFADADVLEWVYEQIANTAAPNQMCQDGVDALLELLDATAALDYVKVDDNGCCLDCGGPSNGGVFRHNASCPNYYWPLATL